MKCIFSSVIIARIHSVLSDHQITSFPIVLNCLYTAFAGRTSLEDDLTVLIDYTKYREFYANRVGRQIENDAGIFPPQPQLDHPPNHGPPHKEPEHGPPPPSVCHDSKNEVYQQCGSKCVPGCRYAVASSSGITISKNECNKNDCVEGCFCKTGLVRHQTKCIPAIECPIRKCHNREEVYVCIFILLSIMMHKMQMMPVELGSETNRGFLFLLFPCLFCRCAAQQRQSLATTRLAAKR